MEIPGFELGARIGEGVYADVFAARRAGGDPCDCAIKILKKPHLNDDWVLDGFRREGRIAAVVKHPNLVRGIASDFGERPFHILRRAAGRILDGAALLPRPIAMSVIAQVASALEALHARGFVHGDVKPANIMLAPNGHATLIDLGFARKAGTLPYGEGLPGTPNYLAPELCRRDFIDTPAADVFSLGVSAFELLTGHLPYDRLNSNEEVLEQHRDGYARSIVEVDHLIPDAMAKLVNAMTQRDLFTRIKLSQVISVLKAQSAMRRAA
jgi:serine/threonine protein kinase